MIFDENNKAIYLQIVDRICDDIMQCRYGPETRLPPVREYAASIEVNANTVMRSYERLTSKGLIYNKRGIGFFVSPDARERIIRERKVELIDRQLPPLFKLMRHLGISPDDLSNAYKDFISGEDKDLIC